MVLLKIIMSFANKDGPLDHDDELCEYPQLLVKILSGLIPFLPIYECRCADVNKVMMSTVTES